MSNELDQLAGLFSDLREHARPRPPSAPVAESAQAAADAHRALVAGVPLGLCRASRDQIVLANPAFLELMGFESLEVAQQRALADLFLDPAEYVALSDQLAHQRQVSGRFQLRRADGAFIVECLLNASAVFDGDGRLAFVDGVFEDAVDHPLSYPPPPQPDAAAPDLWKLRYDVAAVATGQVVYDYDSVTGSMLWGDSLEQVLGYALAEMQGGVSQWAGLVHPDDRWALIGALDSAEEKRAPYQVEYRLRNKSGDYIWLLDRGLFVASSTGQAAHRIGTLRVVDRSTRPETPESGQWLRLVFNSMRAAVLVATLDNHLVSVNAAAEKMFGYTRGELEQLSPEALYADRARYLEMERLVKQCFELDQDAHLRIDARRKDGQVFATRHVISLIKNDAGEPIAILRVIEDLGAERERAQSLDQASTPAATPASRVSAAAPALQELAQFNQFCESNYYARGAVGAALNQLYRRLVTLLKERMGYYHVQLFRYGPLQEAMILVEGYGAVGAQMKAEGQRWLMGRGVVGTAAATGVPCLASDVAASPTWVPTPHLPQTRGELAVPIQLRGKLLGVLDVHADRAGELTQDDQIVLADLAGQIALAIENARLLEKV